MMNLNKNKHKVKQSGMALLVILLLVALMTTIGTIISDKFFMQIRQTQYLNSYLQAKWYFAGAKEAFRAILWQDYKDDPEKTHLGQYWASPINQFPLEDGLLKFSIMDGYSCLNLNGVDQKSGADKNEQAFESTHIELTFIYLFEQLFIDDNQGRELIAGLQDWIDANDEVRPYGAEDIIYTNAQRGYLSANQPLINLSELRLVHGFDVLTINKIRPYVCVLPVNYVKLNINTIKKEQAIILSALTLGELSLDDVISLIEERPITGWSSLDDFYRAAQIEENKELIKAIEPFLVLSSEFFIINLSLSYADNNFFNTSLIHRTPKGISIIQSTPEVIRE